jgi:hypothetical protein
MSAEYVGSFFGTVTGIAWFLMTRCGKKRPDAAMAGLWLAVLLFLFVPGPIHDFADSFNRKPVESPPLVVHAASIAPAVLVPAPVFGKPIQRKHVVRVEEPPYRTTFGRYYSGLKRFDALPQIPEREEGYREQQHRNAEAYMAVFHGTSPMASN